MQGGFAQRVPPHLMNQAMASLPQGGGRAPGGGMSFGNDVMTAKPTSQFAVPGGGYGIRMPMPSPAGGFGRMAPAPGRFSPEQDPRVLKALAMLFGQKRGLKSDAMGGQGFGPGQTPGHAGWQSMWGQQPRAPRAGRHQAA